MATPVQLERDDNKKDFKDQYTIIETRLTEIINGTSTLTNAQIMELYARTLRFILRWIKNRP
ncbi:MAG: hypothetical protein R3307_10655 [Anaerolineales bacterium]|nr:hypothetical protein [Anaerolineales bacterium]